MKPLPSILTAIAAGTFALTMLPAAAQQPDQQPGTICGERESIVQSLTQQFKEEAQAVGVVDENAVLEIFVSDAGTWTIIATGTDGNSCLVSSGEGWDSKSMIIGVDA